MRQFKKVHRFTDVSNKSFGSYLKEIGKFDVLSVDEELSLIKIIRQHEKKISNVILTTLEERAEYTKACNRLVESNLKFVVSVAKQFVTVGFPIEDLINEGNLGLIESVKTYDETRGFKFITYAVWWIRKIIMEHVDSKKFVRIPVNVSARANKIEKSIEALEQQLYREPTAQEIFDYFQGTMEMDKIELIMNNNFKQQPKSFDYAYDNEFTLLDVIEDEDAESPDEAFVNNDLSIQVNKYLQLVKSPMKRDVIIRHFGLNNTSPQLPGTIALHYGIKEDKVKNIIKKTIKDLQKQLVEH